VATIIGYRSAIYLETFEENCFEDFDLQIFSTLPDLDFLDLDVMTDLCSETTGRGDALSVSWEGIFAYAFPPPILIPKVLMKVRQENCLILLVAPLAPHQSWFPHLLELIVV
jgi:hypothetical protein